MDDFQCTNSPISSLALWISPTIICAACIHRCGEIVLVTFRVSVPLPEAINRVPGVPSLMYGAFEISTSDIFEPVPRIDNARVSLRVWLLR